MSNRKITIWPYKLEAVFLQTTVCFTPSWQQDKCLLYLLLTISDWLWQKNSHVTFHEWILYVGRIRIFLGRKYLTWYQSIGIGRDSYCHLQVQPTWPMTGRHQIIRLFICFSEQYLTHIYCFRLWIVISTLFQILLTLQ